MVLYDTVPAAGTNAIIPHVCFRVDCLGQQREISAIIRMADRDINRIILSTAGQAETLNLERVFCFHGSKFLAVL